MSFASGTRRPGGCCCARRPGPPDGCGDLRRSLQPRGCG
jgi:hypothetical protein